MYSNEPEAITCEETTWVGADPGGKGKFGIAVLRSGKVVYAQCVDCAKTAVDTLLRVGVRSISGVGVDAPLWWSSGPSGGRMADQWLRDRHKLSGGVVQQVNSLRGAVLAQGMLFVDLLRSELHVDGVTETHPKALLKAFGFRNWAAFATHFDVEWTLPTGREPVDTEQDQRHHEDLRDAVISAVAAREAFSGHWTMDLSLTRDPLEQDPSAFWLAPVHYYWPVEEPCANGNSETDVGWQPFE